MKRLITYDIIKGNDYSKLYEFIEKYKGIQITESTYENNRYMILNNLGNECGVIAMKFDTYKEYTNTLSMLEMIKKHKARRQNIASNQ